MATSDVNSFIAQFNGGARANRYMVSLTGTPVSIGTNFSFACRASHIPAANIGVVDIPFMGAVAKVPGDRTFDDWNVTVYNDVDWDLRGRFERWVNLMMQNRANTAIYEGSVIYGGAQVQQLNRKGNPIPDATYIIAGMFPLTVGTIDLSWDTNNAVETFDVSFAINWWESAVTS